MMDNRSVVMKLIVCIVLLSCVWCDGIDIDLSRFHPGPENHSVFRKYYTITEDSTKINITNINDDVGMFIIQVHTFVENVTLSTNLELTLHSYVTGTNVGLLWGSDESSSMFYVLRNIAVQKEVRILLVVTLYDEYDPVPGGCNLSFDTPVAPYQVITYNDEYLSVNSQAPSAYGVSCDEDRVEVAMFHLYLPEYDNNNETYFHGIEKMLTVKNILKYGTQVSVPENYFKYRRLYSSYKGTGEVFAIVATYNNKSAAYVPAVSYGCDLLNWQQSCMGPVTDHWKLSMAVQVIFGLFVCFMGHKFFRMTLYMIGFTFGVLITYLTISLEENFTTTERAVTSFIIGFMYGIVWMFFWWKFGIPLLSVHLAFLLTGFLIASIVFYAGLADIPVFTNGMNFWATFVSIMLVSLILLIPFTMYGHIFACSFLGSYACITALNYYVGGNLQYIIINTYRRVAVKNFNYAVIDPPFQMIDTLHSLLWILLLLFGIFIQVRDQRGKPPFPPNRNEVIDAERITERTSLIRAEVPPPEYT
ncbi:unnamed protein product [Phaedon cochleariae]|uniref:TM7S3/TM198-like domain-containing protein n=1 Tax=Phaedon cochleariae TaxID=80249 RepID=A0A9P0GSP9_PHACE|nr:unnamed protein product [Phaedon cochleariae]